jgi:putative resolvase
LRDVRVAEKARRLLSDPKVTVVVVEYRDRLGRMNTHLVEAFLFGSGRCVVVFDDGGVEDDLVRGVTEVLTLFCAGRYGRGSAKDRAERAVVCVAASVEGKPA